MCLNNFSKLVLSPKCSCDCRTALPCHIPASSSPSRVAGVRSPWLRPPPGSCTALGPSCSVTGSEQAAPSFPGSARQEGGGHRGAPDIKTGGRLADQSESRQDDPVQALTMLEGGWPTRPGHGVTTQSRPSPCWTNQTVLPGQVIV